MVLGMRGRKGAWPVASLRIKRLEGIEGERHILEDQSFKFEDVLVNFLLAMT